jgi:hypothetical protein
MGGSRQPHTAACTGHEAGIGTTGEMLLSVSASGEFRPEKITESEGSPVIENRTAGLGWVEGPPPLAATARRFRGRADRAAGRAL